MTSQRTRRYFVLHDIEGRILALAPVGTVQSANGVKLGWRPVPGLQQMLTEIDLTPEMMKLDVREVLGSFRVQVDSRNGKAQLKRHTAS
jgi:hypothetical protein